MSFNGTWQVTISTPIGKQEVIFEIETLNGVITGKATQGAETVAFVNPVASGQRLTWTQQITKPLRLTLTFDVSIEGDTLRGTAKAGFLPASSLLGSRKRA